MGVLGVIEHLQEDGVGQAGIILNGKRNRIGQKDLNVVEDVDVVLFVDLAQNLVVLNGLAEQLLHAQNEAAVSSIGEKLAHDLVLVEEARAERELTHLVDELVDRILELLLLGVNLVRTKPNRQDRVADDFCCQQEVNQVLLVALRRRIVFTQIILQDLVLLGVKHLIELLAILIRRLQIGLLFRHHGPLSE